MCANRKKQKMIESGGPMKIGLVVQRYGQDVIGGSELLCRMMAEKLAQTGFDCTVITTTARDYITWKNEYPSGDFILNGVNIKRFPVEKERDIDSFNKYSEWIFKHEHSKDDEMDWIERQGPVCPEMMEYLGEDEGSFDLFIFFTYLYYNTFWGIRKVQGKKILVPTAHDEPPLYLNTMKPVFSLPQGMIFNTPAEKRLVEEHFTLGEKCVETAGVGMDIPGESDLVDFAARYGLEKPYILYAGRIEKGKGCLEMINCFLESRKQLPGISLVLIGKKLMELPQHEDIRYLGYVSQQEKNAAMAGALTTIHPSRLESLCMAALESMAVRTPVAVQGHCELLVEHCRGSRAGLWFCDCREFAESVRLLQTDERLRTRMGDNGRAYVTNRYSWGAILGKYRRVMQCMEVDSIQGLC
jgi:glycosyltransferase involved in cell wall biosynthesis